MQHWRGPALMLAACAMVSCNAAGETAETNDLPAPRGEIIALTVSDLERFAVDDAFAQGIATLIDVRVPEETASGMIPGAQFLALNTMAPEELANNSAETVIFYSRSNGRAVVAATLYSDYTEGTAYYLEDGIQAWQDAGNQLFHPHLIE